MGDYKDKTGKTRLGKALSTIGSIAPDILRLAGNITGVQSLNKVAEAIDGSANLSAEDKALALEMIQKEKELVFADVADARDLQKVALQQDDKFSKRFIYYLASFWSVASVIYIFIISLTNIPVTSIRLVDTVLGFVLGTIVSTIIAYFFGSSMGSKEKTTLIETIKNSL
jgi:hypothetical protein